MVDLRHVRAIRLVRIVDSRKLVPKIGHYPHRL